MPPPGATLMTVSTVLMNTWNGNVNTWMRDHIPSYTVTTRKIRPSIWEVYLKETLTAQQKNQLTSDFSTELAGNVEVVDT
jgi:hypothetical protein